jgi:hypothetical protein
MLTCGTSRPAGHWSVPKHVWAACDSRPNAERLAAGELLAAVVAVTLAVQRKTQRVDIQAAAAGGIGSDYGHGREELDVHGMSSS